MHVLAARVVGVLGDDGQTYTFTSADGVQIEKESGPLTKAVEDVASSESEPVTTGSATWRNADTDIPVEVIGVEPEPGADGRTYARVKYNGQETFVPADELFNGQPAPSEAAPAIAVPPSDKADQSVEADATMEPAASSPPALPTLAEMYEAQLRERMKYLADQAKMNGGSNKLITSERRKVEAELNSRQKQLPTDVVTEEAKPVESQKAADLPKDLSGAKPRYAYGSKQFDLTFANDVDRAAYIAAQKNPSKRDADFVK